MASTTAVLTRVRTRRRAGTVRSIWRRPLAVIALVIGISWIVVAVAAPLVSPFDPLQQGFPRLTAPSAAHWMGTDQLGRDVLSRVIWGARRSVTPSIAVIAIITVFGGLVGAVAGYFGGIVDGVVMRFTDLLFAFPTIILAMAVVAILGPSVTNAVIAVAIARWPAMARVVRSLVMSLKDAEYVQARRLLGAAPPTLLFVEVLPNVVGPVLVLAALEVGQVILVLAGLSFLGLGTVPPDPDWGSMVSEGTGFLADWWVGAFPGIAIFTVVFAFNLLGDTARDRFDPRLMSPELGQRS